jgi:OOP family OmpA-OmpF porin
MTQFFTALLIFFFTCISAPAADDNLQQQLFGRVDEIRADAEAADASLLSPKSYATAVNNYNRALRDLNNDETLKKIESRLNDAEKGFQEALENAELARITLRKAIDGRNLAKIAEAYRLAPQNWAKADSLFNDAALALEEGNLGRAQTISDEADSAYQLAELNAIKTLHLSEARGLIAEADQARLEKYAPQTIRRAKEFLAQADQALDENRNETAQPIALAAEASYEARHAIFISELARQIRNKDISVEELILTWELPLVATANAAGIELDFSDGYENAGTRLTNEVDTIKRANIRMEEEITQRDQLVLGMEEEMRDLDTKLGGASTERTELIRQLEEQARAREQFAQVRTLFGPDEAIVLRDGNKLIIRLAGLNFSSGSAELTTAAKNLMNTVEDAISIFPRCQIMVEGHTDSYGSAMQNVALSKNRADAVVTYLVNNMNIPPHRITASGYGDTRPITNNRTAAGRAKNRRIDLVITP